LDAADEILDDMLKRIGEEEFAEANSKAWGSDEMGNIGIW
jgi:hypothetical protein